MRTLQALRDRGLIYFNWLTRPTRTTANGHGRKVAAIQRMQITASRPATVAVVLDLKYLNAEANPTPAIA
jgi:hypothetical protein